jgi:hypothetical protein
MSVFSGGLNAATTCLCVDFFPDDEDEDEDEDKDENEGLSLDEPMLPPRMLSQSGVLSLSELAGARSDMSSGKGLHPQKVLLYCCTVILLYCCTVILLYCCTVILLYCCTVVLLYCCTIILVYCYTIILLYCYYKKLLLLILLVLLLRPLVSRLPLTPLTSPPLPLLPLFPPRSRFASVSSPYCSLWQRIRLGRV